jgi:uncharacterized protein
LLAPLAVDRAAQFKILLNSNTATQRNVGARHMKLLTRITVRQASHLLLKHRVAAILCCLVFLTVTSAGMIFLRFNADSRIFFGDDNPELIALNNLEKTYPSTANILFIVAPRSGDVFEPKALTTIGDMTEEAWQIPFTMRVDSLANFNHVRAEGDEIIVRPLYEPGEPVSLEKASAIRAIALGEKELINRLVSAKGDVAAIYVRVVKPPDARDAVVEMALSARQLKHLWQRTHPEMDIYLTGSIIADFTFQEAGKWDMMTLVPVMGLLVVIVLFAGLSSLSATFITVSTVFAASASAMGFAGWMGMPLNTATVGAPVSIMILTLASCIHILTTWLRTHHSTDAANDRLANAIAENFLPIVIASVTTAIGFLCLNFSSSPPLRDLGNIVAFGVIAGMVFCLVLLPALTSYFPPRGGLRFGLTDAAFGRFAEFVISNRRPLTLLFIFVLPIAFFGISRIALEDDYIRYFGKRFEFRQASEFTEERLTGLNVIKYSLPAASKGGIFDPAYLKSVDAFGAWLERQKDVVTVETVADVLKRINKTINREDVDFYRIEDSRALNAQNLFLYEIALPVGLDLNSIISLDRSQSRVTAVLANVTSTRLRELGQQGEAWLRQNAPELQAQATGKSMVFAYLSERNIKSMIGGTILALILISALLLLILKSVKFGIISLLPNLVPAILAFGVWGYFIGQVNLGSSIVTTMTLGIVVDDTVHFLLKYLRARRSEGHSPEEAVKETFSGVGPAIVLTSIALIVGFLVLATSGFAVNHQIGLLCALTVGAALAADLLFLPPVLVYAERSRQK